MVVLASGSGTLLQALLDDPDPRPYRVMAVGSDRPGIPALARAESAGIPTFVCRLPDFADRSSWDSALADACGDAQLVVLAGFMKLLGPSFLSRFQSRVINSHPSLLPSFPGMRAPADALAHGVKITGCTVFTVNGGIDTGPILAQRAVPVEPGDDVHSLHERIKVAERAQLVAVVRDWANQAGRVAERESDDPEGQS